MDKMKQHTETALNYFQPTSKPESPGEWKKEKEKRGIRNIEQDNIFN